MLVRYRINSPAVASEVIDGEAVILHLPSGRYFSAAASGGVIWAGIEADLAVDQLLDRLTDRYALSRGEARAALEGFVAELLRHGLIRETSEPPPPAGSAMINAGETRGAFTTPHLHVYSDRQDLLLLDPRHAVDQAGGPLAPPVTRA